MTRDPKPTPTWKNETTITRESSEYSSLACVDTLPLQVVLLRHQRLVHELLHVAVEQFGHLRIDGQSGGRFATAGFRPIVLVQAELLVELEQLVICHLIKQSTLINV